MADMIMDFKGVNGQIELYNDKVVIKRKGAIAKMSQGFFKGDKTIYLKQISGIQVKQGSNLTNGYIQFTVPGGNESTKGLAKATQDENTVMFAKKDNDTVAAMVLKIEGLQQKEAAPVTSISTADEIKKFKQLLDEGIITEQEFNSKKQELLKL